MFTAGLGFGCLRPENPPTVADADAGIRGGGILSGLGRGCASDLSAASPELDLELPRFHDKLSFLRSDVFEEGLRGSCVSAGFGGGDFGTGLSL